MANVFITGCNRGIGLELCRTYLVEGHKVFATCRDYEKADELRSLKSDFPDTLFVHELDVAKPETFDGLVKQLPEPIDILINNAGMLVGRGDRVAELSPDDVMKVFDVNVLGPLRVTQLLMPRLSKNPVIASISSMMGSIADNTSGGSYGYRISKAALNMFNKSLSLELIQAICVVLHPGWVQTDMGGSQAPTKTSESAEGIKKVLSKVTAKDTGHFFDFTGKTLPW